MNLNLAISPYLEIKNEVRVILVDDLPVIVYGKSRPSITGDGVHSILELALAAMPAERLSAILPRMAGDLDSATLDTVLPPGQHHALNWRHNLDAGAEPVLLQQGETRERCVELAIKAAKSIDLRFGSIDVVQVDDGWRVLEINSGVVMEALGKTHPDLVYAAYAAALDKVFGDPHTPPSSWEPRTCAASRRTAARTALVADPSRLAAVRRAPQDDGSVGLAVNCSRPASRPAP